MKIVMLKKFLFLSATILFINLSLCGQYQLRAGAARVNITPPLGTIINGDFLPGYANSIHDSLYARALAFDNGKEKFVFVVVDNMTLDAGLINSAKVIDT